MSSQKTKGVVKASEGVEVEDVGNSEGITIQRLIVDRDGSERIHMRKFTMKPGAWMKFHKHDNCEHVQYFLKGEVKLKMGDEEYDVEKDDAVFIPADTPHSYENHGDEEARFLCIVPGIDIETDILG